MVNTHLRATLRANGYSEADLARELGVDAKTVQRWVTQDRTPHRSTAVKVAKLLDVPTAGRGLGWMRTQRRVPPGGGGVLPAPGRNS